MIMGRYPLFALAGALLMSVTFGGPVLGCGGGGGGGGGGGANTSTFGSEAPGEADTAAVDTENLADDLDLAIAQFTVTAAEEPGNADG
jgi:hypothetical protein